MGPISLERRTQCKILFLGFSGTMHHTGSLCASLTKVPQILDNLPPNTDAASITLSNKPVSTKSNPENERRLADLPGIEIHQVGLKLVIYPCFRGFADDIFQTWR